MAVASWPDGLRWNSIEVQPVVPGQINRRSGPPHNPRPPEWRIVTTLLRRADDEMSRFLSSLGGADTVVELPLYGDNVYLPPRKAKADDGEWAVTNARLGERYLEVTVRPRSDAQAPPGCLVQVGNASSSRLYEVSEADGGSLMLSPRVAPPTGTTRLLRADTVRCRLDSSNDPRWGVRSTNVVGSFPGTTISWREEIE